MSAEEPKKKRKQNVACDSCKLRRIKCDLSELLAALPSSSTSSVNLSLSDLVRQHPDVGCSQCKNKGLKCATEGIINPTKPNKGGKRIEEAKKKFGNNQDERRSSDVHGSRISGDDSWNTPVAGPATQLNPVTHLQPALGGVDGNPMLPIVEGTNTSISQGITPLTPGKPPDFTEQDMFKFLFPDFPPQQHAHSHALGTEHPSLFGSFPPELDLNAPIPTFTQPSNDHLLQGGTKEANTSNFDRAWAIWQGFASSPKTALEHYRATGQIPGSDSTPSPAQGTPLDIVIDQITSIQREKPCNLLGGRTENPDQRAVSSSSAHTPFSDRSTECPDSDLSSQQLGQKRSRPSTASPGDIRRAGKMVLLTSDPWQLYSRSQNRDVVHWGRREAVQERLADKALGMALSAHLVKVFFQAVHLSYPAISPETFYLDWARAGQRSDRMEPAQEVLCAVIEAWGARYSDCPVILGLDPKKADHAPKVIQKDGTFIPGTRARTHWGRARISACKALMDRARRLIDDNALLRRPSVTGVQALTLYSQLSHMTDQKIVDQDHWLQARMIHSTIIEQMSLLGLMWDSDTPVVTDRSEARLTAPQVQIRQRRLFWTHMIGDAFFAASIGQIPKMSQANVDLAGEWIETMHENLPQSSFKLLAFFITIYHRLGVAAREMAVKVAYPLRKKGAGDVPKICGTIRKLWKEILDIENTLNDNVYDLLRACHRNELLGFSPVNYLSNLRLSAPFLLLILHQLIREQLDFWKNVSGAYIATPSDASTPSSSASAHTSTREAKSGSSRNVELLDRLNSESVDGLLRSCRAQTGMIKSIMPTGIIQSASVLLRALMATVQLLAEVPTNEQGYPSWTPGGKGWTWEAKQREVDCCCEALHQLGWAWADVGDVLDAVMLTMERLTPSPEELRQWELKQENGQAPTKDEVAQLQKENQAENDKVMGAVLHFWPPVSIPHLIESAMQKGPQWIKEGSIDQITDHISSSLRATPLTTSDALSQTQSQPLSSPAFMVDPNGSTEPASSSNGGRTDTLAQPLPQQAALSPFSQEWLDTLTGTNDAQVSVEGGQGMMPNLLASATQAETGTMADFNSAPYPHVANHRPPQLPGTEASASDQPFGNDYTGLHQQPFMDPGRPSHTASSGHNPSPVLSFPPDHPSETQQELQNFLDRLYSDQALTMNQLSNTTTATNPGLQSEPSHTHQPGCQTDSNPTHVPAQAQTGVQDDVETFDRSERSISEIGKVSLSPNEWIGLDAIYGGSRNV
ncbi:hypothetical protein IAU59_004734 [Kwoniella sp. CBS 9459]